MRRSALLAVLFAIVSSTAIAAPSQTHPRLWMTTDDMPRLRSWAVASNPLYQDGLLAAALTAKAYADEHWNYGTDKQRAQVQLRWAANKYFIGHMRNITLMALSFDKADDTPRSTIGQSLESLIADGIGFPASKRPTIGGVFTGRKLQQPE